MLQTDIETPEKAENSVIPGTPERLIRALRSRWATVGQGEISVRAIAAEAEAAPSAIDYHFGSLEQLFEAAQARCIVEASDWMRTCLSNLADGAPDAWPLAARAALFGAIIDDWTEAQRPLALAWREAQCAAKERRAHEASLARWSGLWRAFIGDVCMLTGLDAWTDTLLLFFHGEAAQHLIRWRRPLDRALLEETVAALFAFLAQRDATPSAAVRDAYQQIAGAEYAEFRAALDMSSPLDEAAAGLLADEGLAALTFRAVARRAGATLGTVAYHFGTKHDLAQRALHRLYEMSSGGPAASFAAPFPGAPVELLDAVIDAAVIDNAPILRALDEIVHSLSRDSNIGSFRAATRAFRDPVGIVVLERLLNGVTPTSSLTAAFSSIVRGLRNYSRAVGHDQGYAVGKRALEMFVAR